MKELIIGFGRRALTFGIFAAIAAVSTTSVLADDRGYILTQRGENFGDQYVYISPYGVLFKNPSVGAGLFMHAPDWNVTVYNEKVRIYYQATMAQYKLDVANRGSGTKSDMQGWNWNPVSGNENICGLVCTEYKMSGFNTIHRRNRASMSISDGIYWAANDIVVTPELGQFLDSMYGLPPTQRYPVRLTAVDHGKPKVLLDTYRAQATSIPISYFALPPGLSPVLNYAEMYMTDQEIIADMQKEYNRRSDGTTGGTIKVGGINWDKAKLQRVIETLKHAH
jgi:hypothetical protein